MPFDFTLADGTAKRRELSLGRSGDGQRRLPVPALRPDAAPTGRRLRRPRRARADGPAGGNLARRRPRHPRGVRATPRGPTPSTTRSSAWTTPTAPATPTSREDAFLEAGETAGAAEHRLGSLFYGDLPCASWPVHPASEARPAYLVTDAFPMLVLASTTDPATPYAGARRIFENAGDGYLVTQPGGPHIIFGRGNPCPDDLVTAFLVAGELPGRPRDGRASRWRPIRTFRSRPHRLQRHRRPAGAAGGHRRRDRAPRPTTGHGTGSRIWRSGCLHGGTMTYAATDVGSEVTLVRVRDGRRAAAVRRPG